MNYVRMTIWVEKDQRKWLLKQPSASEMVRQLVEAAQTAERSVQIKHNK